MMTAPKKSQTARTRKQLALLAATYPGATCELDFQDPYQLLVATILSAQSTDRRVNLVTPALFKRFPDAASLARARPATVEKMVHSTGFFRAKTRSLLGMARKLVADHG